MLTKIDVQDLPESQIYLVQEFVEFLRNKFKNEVSLRENEDWTMLSTGNFAKDWDNEKDAIYDKWSEYYHVPER